MTKWQRRLLYLALFLGFSSLGVGIAFYSKIQDSRFQAAVDSCRGRNIERGIQRASLVRQLNSIRTLPDKLFAQFQTTRKESIRNVEMDINSLFLINCKEYAKEVIQK